DLVRLEASIAMTESLQQRIADATARSSEIDNLMMLPEVLSDARRMQQLGREQNLLMPIVDRGRTLANVERQIEDSRGLLAEADAEMRELVEDELKSLETHREQLTAELIELLQPRDPNDD